MWSTNPWDLEYYNVSLLPNKRSVSRVAPDYPLTTKPQIVPIRVAITTDVDWETIRWDVGTCFHPGVVRDAILDLSFLCVIKISHFDSVPAILWLIFGNQQFWSSFAKFSVFYRAIRPHLGVVHLMRLMLTKSFCRSQCWTSNATPSDHCCHGDRRRFSIFSFLFQTHRPLFYFTPSSTHAISNSNFPVIHFRTLYNC